MNIDSYIANYWIKERKMTLGEYRVGVSFNPSQDPAVASIKAHAAALIDEIAALRANKTQGVEDAELRGEVCRLCALAVTDIENAAMWAVKAATKGPM